MIDLDDLVARAPQSIPGAWTLGEAAGIAARLPVAAYVDARPVGVGVFPPRGAEPVVRTRGRIRAVDGHVVAGGARGLVGCLWAGKAGPVHRIWFQAHGSAMRFVDCYADQIRSVEGLGDAPPKLLWEIREL